MTDNLTIEQRKKTMSRVKSKDTAPEMRVRKLTHKLGYRFRLHSKDLPGKPDLVFPSKRKIINVNGCFWHGHNGCPASKRPKSNVEYWTQKIERNIARDLSNQRKLAELGWQTLVIWECETKNEGELSLKIQNFLEPKPTFYEFFAGGGMARLGLGNKWRCTLSNDVCSKKAKSYQDNHKPLYELEIDDVDNLTTNKLPGQAHLSWASFPCQDLSLAGNGKGLKGKRSGTYWSFWDLMIGLVNENRKVPIIVLENVVGALSSNKGNDFKVIMESIVDQEYFAGAMVINAVRFVPQSRPRLFIIAVDKNWEIPENLIANKPLEFCHSKKVIQARSQLPRNLKDNWIWWNLPQPPPLAKDLIDIIEDTPTGVNWHTKDETQQLLNLMNDVHLKKVKEAQKNGIKVGTLYKRTRKNGNGDREQRAEVRFDQISGCLRTPAGGSSRQTLIFVNNGNIRTRLLSPREAARLMGLADTYILPEKYNEAYHLAGDGLVVPLVSWLEQHILSPLVALNQE